MRRFRADEDEFESDERWYRTDMEKFRLDEQWYRSDEDEFGQDIFILLKDLYWFTSDEGFLNPNMERYSLDADEYELAIALRRANRVGIFGTSRSRAASG